MDGDDSYFGEICGATGGRAGGGFGLSFGEVKGYANCEVVA
jgi:hypothetical protein